MIMDDIWMKRALSVCQMEIRKKNIPEFTNQVNNGMRIAIKFGFGQEKTLENLVTQNKRSLQSKSLFNIKCMEI